MSLFLNVAIDALPPHKYMDFGNLMYLDQGLATFVADGTMVLAFPRAVNPTN